MFLILSLNKLLNNPSGLAGKYIYDGLIEYDAWL